MRAFESTLRTGPLSHVGARPARASFFQEDFIRRAASSVRLTAEGMSVPSGTLGVLNTQLTYKFQGSLQVSAAIGALEKVAERHEILRTTFSESTAGYFQNVCAGSNARVDIKQILATSTEVDSEIRSVLREAGALYTDFGQGPLVRLVIIQMHDCSVLSFVLSHAISDGPSLPILATEFWSSYAAIMNDQPANVAPLPLQFSDFASEERAFFNEERLLAHLKYWRQCQQNPPEVLLPMDRCAPTGRFRGGWGRIQHLELTQGLSSDIRQSARRQHTTLLAFMVSACILAIRHYSTNPDVMVCNVLNNRLWPEAERVIGPFLNSSWLRTNVDDGCHLEDVLHEAMAQISEAMEHNIPGAVVFPERPRVPTVNFQEVHELGWSGLPVRRLVDDHLIVGPTNFRIYAGNVITLAISYNPVAFSESRVTQMLAHIAFVLNALCTHPSMTVADLSQMASKCGFAGLVISG